MQNMIIGLSIAAVAFLIVISNIRIVQQAKAFVIERLGAYKGTWNVGLHVKCPFIDRVAKALHKAFHPDKINYGAYGDTGHHLHFHLVPKYRDGYEWGGVFAMNPKEKYLTDAEYQALIEAIRANL